MSTLTFATSRRPAAGAADVLLGAGLLFAGAIGLLAVGSPSVAVAAVVGVAFVVIAFRDLALGVVAFTTLTFFARLPGVAGASVSMIKAAGGVLLLAWLVRILNRRRTSTFLLSEHPALAGAIVFLGVWAVSSAVWAASAPTALSSGFRLLQGLVLVFVVYSALQEDRHILWFLSAFIVGALLTTLVGLAHGTTDQVSAYADSSRLAGSIGDANELAALLCPALFFAAFMLGVARGVLTRLALAGASCVFVIALLLTGSRGGIVATGLALVATIVFAGPARSRAVVVFLGVAAFACAYFALLSTPAQLHRLTSFSAGGGTGRTDLWSIALAVAQNHPVAGVGAGNFQVVEPGYALSDISLQRFDLVVDTPKVTHNTYLQMLAELGVVGAIAFMAMIAAALTLAIRATRIFAREGRMRMELAARGTVIGTVGMLGAFVFISAQYEKQLWLLLGVSAALTNAARTSRLAFGRDGDGEGADYDPAVSQHLVEQLELRLTERMDALLDESRKLEIRRSSLALREQAIAAKARELARAKPEDPIAGASEEVEHLRTRLSEREAELGGLQATIEALETRERELTAAVAALAEERNALAESARDLRSSAELVAEREATLAARLQEVADRERQVAAAAREEPPEVAAARQAIDEELRSLEARKSALAKLESDRVAREREVVERERELAARAQSLEAREAALSKLETARADRERRIEERERALAAREEALTARPVEEVAPAHAAPERVEAHEEWAAWSLAEIERAVAQRGGEFPDRIEEWQFYLQSLREHADPSGRLPVSVDWLLRDVFGPLLRA